MTGKKTLRDTTGGVQCAREPVSVFWPQEKKKEKKRTEEEHPGFFLTDELDNSLKCRLSL